ncbi:hypothetical protein BDB00DRAFT_832229 [Zychaea mexicana]|uniref:uncharacterized protein n=1 Tax=Zychaea mexicana TaxID=64656 RepID=UPI0022FE724F|nr:uncharacterized protein BDB00DRAFT_832229 [Zychaea mexicana]KAI9491625.1 hypothetical protein BDB00DRAFT_832229 [Zychaea mexicana]
MTSERAIHMAANYFDMNGRFPYVRVAGTGCQAEHGVCQFATATSWRVHSETMAAEVAAPYRH